MVFVTGDCHGDWSRFFQPYFLSKWGPSKDDIIIVCGDFGIWHDTEKERSDLNNLETLPFKIAFCDGNHSNFDRLYSDEFPIVDFHGGKAHQIRKNVFHVMRGNVLEIEGKRFFVMGGASSHDIADGILDISDYSSDDDMLTDYFRRCNFGEMIRVNHVSWWKEELPSVEEMAYGWKKLKENDYKIDYIISHCAPQRIASTFSHGLYQEDSLTKYFDEISERVSFSKWYFGHYHDDRSIGSKYLMLYENIIRIV